jgi:hypothetical protein
MPARINPTLDLIQIPNDLPAANGNTTREFPLLFEVINGSLTQGDHCQQLLFADEHFARLPRFFLHTELLVLSYLDVRLLPHISRAFH